MNTSFHLQGYGITVPEIHRNLPPSLLYEHAIRYEKDASIADNGALVAYSGVKTGRSPKDKRVVKDSRSEADVWWGSVNIPTGVPLVYQLDADLKPIRHEYLGDPDEVARAMAAVAGQGKANTAG